MNISRFIPLMLFAGLLIVLIVALRQEELPGNDPMAGRKVPVFALPSLHEKNDPYETGDIRGKLTLVNFFASWCAPCAAEHPLLLELRGNPHLTVDGIAWKDTPEKAENWLKRKGNPYRHVGIDEQGKAAIGFGLRGVPESYLIDDTGTILWHTAGPLTRDSLKEIQSFTGGAK